MNAQLHRSGRCTIWHGSTRLLYHRGFYDKVVDNQQRLSPRNWRRNCQFELQLHTVATHLGEASKARTIDYGETLVAGTIAVRALQCPTTYVGGASLKGEHLIKPFPLAPVKE